MAKDRGKEDIISLEYKNEKGRRNSKKKIKKAERDTNISDK